MVSIVRNNHWNPLICLIQGQSCSICGSIFPECERQWRLWCLSPFDARGCRRWRSAPFLYILFRFYPIFLDLGALSALTVSDAPVDVFSTPPQLDGELITLTLLPRSRWQTLLNLEVIQVWEFCPFFELYDWLPLFSKETNQKNRRKFPRKHLSSYQLCLV